MRKSILIKIYIFLYNIQGDFKSCYENDWDWNDWDL